MQSILVIHSIFRWFILLFGLWAVFNAIKGSSSNKLYTSTDNKISLFFMISCDVQLLIGLILYFNGPWFSLIKDNAKEVMKNSTERFFAMEHIVMMLIAWVLVHIGRSAAKRAATDKQKHKRSLVYFGIALLIILAMIPWPFRQPGIARALFPQF